MGNSSTSIHEISCITETWIQSSLPDSRAVSTMNCTCSLSSFFSSSASRSAIFSLFVRRTLEARYEYAINRSNFLKAALNDSNQVKRIIKKGSHSSLTSGIVWSPIVDKKDHLDVKMSSRLPTDHVRGGECIISHAKHHANDSRSCRYHRVNFSSRYSSKSTAMKGVVPARS